MRNGLLLLLAGTFICGCFDGKDDDSLVEEFAKDASGNGIPKISGDPPKEITIQEMYDFEPIAKDLEGDKLTFQVENKPDWAIFDEVTGRLWGQPGNAHIGTYSDVTISVTDGMAQSALPSFQIHVNEMGEYSLTMTWDAPTENEDGSALTDLAGYRIFYGKQSGQYTHEIQIDQPGTTTHPIGNLSAGTYYFAAKAVAYSGLESEYSNEAIRELGL